VRCSLWGFKPKLASNWGPFFSEAHRGRRCCSCGLGLMSCVTRQSLLSLPIATAAESFCRLSSDTGEGWAPIPALWSQLCSAAWCSWSANRFNLILEGLSRCRRYQIPHWNGYWPFFAAGCSLDERWCHSALCLRKGVKSGVLRPAQPHAGLPVLPPAPMQPQEMCSCLAGTWLLQQQRKGV